MEVLTALGGVSITESVIQGSPREIIHGLAEGGKVWVNPAPQTVDTVIHELLHVLHPAWGEAYTKNRTTYLINRLSNEEVQEIYKQYQARVKSTRKAKKA